MDEQKNIKITPIDSKSAVERVVRPLRFRKKPVIIEAIQWLGYNFVEIEQFVGNNRPISCIEDKLVIDTLEGKMEASYLDWIIKGVKGECYPCKPDIFEQTYEAV